MNKKAMLATTARWIAARAVTLVIFILAIWGAYTLGRHSGTPPAQETTVDRHEDHEEEVWTCTMHPQIRVSEPGDCPICGMDLVLDESVDTAPPEAPPADEAGPAGYACSMFCVPPLPEPGKCPVCGMDMVAVYDEPSAEGDTERRMVMSEEARALARIQTTAAVRREVNRELRLVGIIDADETRLARVTAYVPGRLDRLHVRFTGAYVQQGAPLAGLYSPELLTARAELQQAKNSAARLSDSGLASVRDTAESTVRAARERLRLWGLSDAQVQALESGNATDAIITIPAPISGTVLERHVQQGDYVDTGSLMFTVADLSTVWVQIKAYEGDVAGIETGLPVRFSVDSLPGEVFEGTVAFIDPVLDTSSRTVDVRVEADNQDGLLKPGMFTRAQLDIPVRLPGEETPLLIPATAPLVTGARAVVYVEIPGQDRPTFEGREVRLGPRAGDYYVVKEGVQEHERVVTKGAFRIDSALQIRTRPSMMQPDAREEEPHDHETDHDHVDCCPTQVATEHPADGPASLPDEKAAAALRKVLDAYIATQQALAADEFENGRTGYGSLVTAIDDFDAAESGEETVQLPEAFSEALNTMRTAAQQGRDSEAIDVARRHFQPVSDAFIALLETSSGWVESEVVQVFCPMAFDDAGAAWLQRGEAVRNPYFGASMLQCGVIRERYAPDEHAH